MKYAILDEYEIKARYIPAILNSLPLIMLVSLAKKDILFSLFSASSLFLIVENISFSAVFIIFLIHIQGFIAKYLFEEIIFDRENKFPTTIMLLWRDKRLSNQYKIQIHKKIAMDFQLSLLSPENEKKSINEAIKLVKDAVSLIRRNVGKGTLTFQHNIEYGFMRNFFAGTIFSIPIAILNIIIFNLWVINIYGTVISTIALLVYTISLLFSRPVLKKIAENYANMLFSDFMTN